MRITTFSKGQPGSVFDRIANLHEKEIFAFNDRAHILEYHVTIACNRYVAGPILDC